MKNLGLKTLVLICLLALIVTIEAFNIKKLNGFEKNLNEKPKKTPEEFKPKGKTLTFLVHDSSTTAQMIQEMQSEMKNVIHDVIEQDSKWIYNYELYAFDDTNVNPVIENANSKEFLKGFKKFTETNAKNTTKASCIDIAVIQSLYIKLALSPNPSLIYVFMNGIINYNQQLLNVTKELINETKSKINFVQINSQPCGQPIGADGPKLMWDIANFSGGQVYVISVENTNNVMDLIQYEYKSSIIFQESYPDCSNGQKFSFPINLNTKTATILINGDLMYNPEYTHPNGIYWPSVATLYNYFKSNSTVQQIGPLCDQSKGYSVYFDGKCWWFNSVSSNWFKAKEVCNNIGSILVDILDSKTQEYLGVQAGSVTYWTGLNDLDKNGKFVWDQGNDTAIPLRSFLNWGKYEQNKKVGKCVTDDIDNKWRVENCDDLNPIICVKNAYSFDTAGNPIISVDPGIWSVYLRTYNGPCSIQVSTQSKNP